MDGEAEGRAQRGFEGSEGDFAVALGEVRVAGVEEGALDGNGEEEVGADGEVAYVEIASVRAGWHRVDRGFGGGSGAHDAEEGAEREADVATVAHGEAATAVVVDGGDQADRVGALRVFAGERALAVAVADHSVGGAAAQAEDFHFEYVAGLGPLDVDGSCDHVRAVDGGVVKSGGSGELGRVVEDAVDAGRGEEGGRVSPLVGEDALVADGVEGDARARRDRKGRLGAGVGEQTPVHCGWVGGEVVVAVDGAAVGLEERHRASWRSAAVRVKPKHWRTL